MIHDEDSLAVWELELQSLLAGLRKELWQRGLLIWQKACFWRRSPYHFPQQQSLLFLDHALTACSAASCARPSTVPG